MNFYCTDLSVHFQMDQFESEIESLMATQKKKKMDKDKSDRIEDLKEYIDRHQYHIKKLEILMRMLDNQSIDCDQVDICLHFIVLSSLL